MKKGAFLVAHRAGVPVLPCVVLGTHRLNELGPWLPFKNAYIWVIYGRPIEPSLNASPKAAREQLAAEWQAQVMELYAELRERYGIRDRDIP